jgi:hypothetical protein
MITIALVTERLFEMSLGKFFYSPSYTYTVYAYALLCVLLRLRFIFSGSFSYRAILLYTIVIMYRCAIIRVLHTADRERSHLMCERRHARLPYRNICTRVFQLRLYLIVVKGVGTNSAFFNAF